MTQLRYGGPECSIHGPLDEWPEHQSKSVEPLLQCAPSANRVEQPSFQIRNDIVEGDDSVRQFRKRASKEHVSTSGMEPDPQRFATIGRLYHERSGQLPRGKSALLTTRDAVTAHFGKWLTQMQDELRPTVWDHRLDSATAIRHTQRPETSYNAAKRGRRKPLEVFHTSPVNGSGRGSTATLPDAAALIRLNPVQHVQPNRPAIYNRLHLSALTSEEMSCVRHDKRRTSTGLAPSPSRSHVSQNSHGFLPA